MTRYSLRIFGVLFFNLLCSESSFFFFAPIEVPSPSSPAGNLKQMKKSLKNVHDIIQERLEAVGQKPIKPENSVFLKDEFSVLVVTILTGGYVPRQSNGKLCCSVAVYNILKMKGDSQIILLYNEALSDVYFEYSDCQNGIKTDHGFFKPLDPKESIVVRTRKDEHEKRIMQKSDVMSNAFMNSFWGRDASTHVTWRIGTKIPVKPYQSSIFSAHSEELERKLVTDDGKEIWHQ